MSDRLRSQRMVNSKQKGKAGELEVAKLLREHGGFSARRGQQFSGSPDSPDVVHEIPGVHLEVKRTENLQIYQSLEQAENDRGEQEIPVVFHRRNKKPWIVIMYADDWLDIMAERE